MKIRNIFLTILGFACLGLGALGVVLPVLPTTPFVLLAAICFSASNKKFHDRLRRNRVFGQYIENYHTKQGISMWLKVSSIAFLWTGLAISAVIVRAVWVYVVLGIVGVGVTTHLLLIKTKKKPREQEHINGAMDFVAQKD